MGRMGRRRARGTLPAKPFDEAFPLIDTLENAVVTHMTPVDFTVQEALLAMFTEDTVAVMKAAWPVIRSIDRGSVISERVIIPVAGSTAVTATVAISAVRAKICVPEIGSLQMDQVLAFSPLVKALQEAHEQHLQFEKVRFAVRWLNFYATVGAARHYCPWLTSLLPLDHAFQKVDGVIYREPIMGIVAIMETMRECHAIVAGALLAGAREDSGKHDFLVSFHGQRDLVSFHGQRDTEAYVSQQFGLI